MNARLEIIVLLVFIILGMNAQAQGIKDRLFAEEYLFLGQRIVANSCFYRLDMQHDGNLVLLNNAGSSSAKPIWASHTNQRGAFYATMQVDGNFVIYTRNHQPLWSTNTHSNTNSVLVLQDDGNLVVYKGSQPKWASDTNGQSIGSSNCSTKSETTVVNFGHDRPGMDYNNFAIGANWEICAERCVGDGAQCKAFTYVPPGIQGAKARCWLKNGVPNSNRNSTMVSGWISNR